MKVQNMTSSNGNKIANQFLIDNGLQQVFQSYDSVIAIKDWNTGNFTITLDSTYWDYSVTTLKYLHQFLGTHSKKEIEQRIASGEYKLANLN